jgi:hypothetical protein
MEKAATKAVSMGAPYVLVRNLMEGGAAKRPRTIAPMDSASSDRIASALSPGPLSPHQLHLGSFYNDPLKAPLSNTTTTNNSSPPPVGDPPLLYRATVPGKGTFSSPAAAQKIDNVDSPREAMMGVNPGVVEQSRSSLSMQELSKPLLPVPASNPAPFHQYAAPTHNDISLLRQIIDNDSSDAMFVVPRGCDPVLAGSAAVDAYQSSIDALRAELSDNPVNCAVPMSKVQSQPPSSAVAPSAFDGVIASDIPPAALPLSERALKQLDSFDKWCNTVPSSVEGQTADCHQQPTFPVDARLLKESDSLDRFWNSVTFDNDVPPPIQPLNAVSTTSSDTLAIRQPQFMMPSQSAVGGEGLRLPTIVSGDAATLDLASKLASEGMGDAMMTDESLLEDVLGMLDEPPPCAYYPPSDELVRLSFKMFDRYPDDLTPDLRSRVEEMLGGGSVAGAYLQHGCTLVTLDVVTDDSCSLGSHELFAARLSAHLLAAPEGHFLRGKGAIAASPGATVRVEDGKVVASTGTSALAPKLLGADACALPCGPSAPAIVDITLYAVHRALSSGCSLDSLTVSVRHAGCFVEAEVDEVAALGVAPTADPDALLLRIRVRVPTSDLSEGLLMLELVAAEGLVSQPLPLVATPNVVIRRELASLGAARPLGKKKDGLLPRLVADLGLVLDFVNSEGTVRDPAVQLGANAFDSLDRHVRCMASRARAVLLTAADRGWTGVAAAMLEAAAVDCPDAVSAVAAVDALRPCGVGLLQAVIRRNNPVLLSMILEWVEANSHGRLLAVAAPSMQGRAVSPLHLAAALDDGGVAAELLLQHAAPCDEGEQALLWTQPGPRGLSPAEVASRCRRTSTAARMSRKRGFVAPATHGGPIRAGGNWGETRRQVSLEARRNFRRTSGSIPETDVVDSPSEVEDVVAGAERAAPSETWGQVDLSSLAAARHLWDESQKKEAERQSRLTAGQSCEGEAAGEQDRHGLDKWDSARGYDYTAPASLGSSPPDSLPNLDPLPGPVPVANVIEVVLQKRNVEEDEVGTESHLHGCSSEGDKGEGSGAGKEAASRGRVIFIPKECDNEPEEAAAADRNAFDTPMGNQLRSVHSFRDGRGSRRDDVEISKAIARSRTAPRSELLAAAIEAELAESDEA